MSEKKMKDEFALPLKVCRIPLTQGGFTLVNAADFKELSKHNWRCWAARGQKYAVRDNWPKRSHVIMHREILKPSANMQVDHINGNGLDNRRENLRIATNTQNQHNAKLSKTNTSGYKGVGHRKQGRWEAWQAKIRKDGKDFHLGYFRSAKEAAIAYDTAAKVLRGKFAKTNRMLGLLEKGGE